MDNVYVQTQTQSISYELPEENKLINISNTWTYPSDTIRFDKFELFIPSGSINLSNSIGVILGENGTGKTIANKQDFNTKNLVYWRYRERTRD
jgi:translation initiation factor RLI1